MAPRVRGLEAFVDETPQELMQTLPELSGLQPASSQSDLALILGKAGENVQAYFRNFANTSATEETEQQRLRANGKVEGNHKQKFRYLMINHPDRPGVNLEEIRADKKGQPTEQAPMRGVGTLTYGFASLPMHFLPEFQSESRFRFLGRQRVEGYETDVLAFAQKPEGAELKERFLDVGASYTAFLQGLAWIDSTTFQIVHMRTDLLPDMAVRSVQSQTTDVSFGEVHFQNASRAFWLPRRVVVETNWNGERFRNFHRYLDYKLFSVDAKQVR